MANKIKQYRYYNDSGDATTRNQPLFLADGTTLVTYNHFVIHSQH